MRSISERSVETPVRSFWATSLSSGGVDAGSELSSRSYSAQGSAKNAPLWSGASEKVSVNPEIVPVTHWASAE